MGLYTLAALHRLQHRSLCSRLALLVSLMRPNKLQSSSRLL